MRWTKGLREEGGIRFSAQPDEVEGYGGRGVDGSAVTTAAGYLLRDEAGDAWRVIFQPYPESSSHGDRVIGDILACSESHDEVVHVRLLASGVRWADATAAFRQDAPVRYEDAARVASTVPRAAG
ncbi:hypothetical protein LFT45_16945 [Arthrobacter sp. FW305-BF8]|uniref:hypothetical protein n=1 Tax=Arthrobacter sp. FW305-BF8 TaxID=2879617 RepID=UPI001F35EA56|nr:hypothetical protein [Arthrobacter sp. FW305-BF8]UKA53396.1 hypothetical protein LFT45_16945 [Arthrobacter sp. FW305-BF8]